MKKIVSIILAACMLAFAAPGAFAADGEAPVGSGTLNVLAYNVSGLPLIGDFQGTVVTGTFQRARLIGGLLNSVDVDFIGVEEDFTAHDALAEEMTAYPYRSPNSGGLTAGSGVNVFSSHKIYNVTREKWRFEYGNLSGSTDALSNKGFVYCVMELEPGVYFDVICAHCDAGFDPISVLCRADNFRQMAKFINENLSTKRPLIVMGDLNYKFRRNLPDDLFGNLLEPTGLKDMWTELYNNSLYDFTDEGWQDGPGDDLDRILYRSGDCVTIEPVSKTVPELYGENGERYTDHAPMLGTFSYTVNEYETDLETMTEPEPANKLLLAFKELLYAFVRVFQLVIGLVEIPYLAAQGVYIAANGNMP
ncbi:MAG: endonuclease/exonuclease/phosphatase family protein [Clostridia bacterium]|nr:endonuclease/exonuclease/phosphatase family protein [Clostridia bacterium]